MTRDRIVHTVAAVMTCATAIAVNHGWITAGDGEQITLMIGTGVIGYHAQNDQSRVG